VTFTGAIPDLDHYKGSFGGRVFPLWRDRVTSVSNIPPNLLTYLSERYGRPVSAEDFIAYVAAILANPAFTTRFKSDLIQPGLRVPITAEGEVFTAAAEFGRTIIWLHAFGERFTDPRRGRPASPPRLPNDTAPRIPAAGAISLDPAEMPDYIDYDNAKSRLLIGSGYVEGVTPEMWNYEVSGKQVLRQWFSYRKANRERPIIGDRRPPSKLSDIQPAHWLAEYTTELINVLNVIGRLVNLEPAQAELLDQVCSGRLISAEELHSSGAITALATQRPKAGTRSSPNQLDLLH
jgi:hypothetical protein